MAVASFLFAVLATYMTAFGVAEVTRGALLTGPPHDPLSFLRVVDPRESIVTAVESVASLDVSVLDEPGLAVLLEHMSGEPRLVLSLPLVAFTDRWDLDVSAQSDALAVVGAAPPFVAEEVSDGDVFLWGSIAPDYRSVPYVTDEEIYGHSVQRVSPRPLNADFVTGEGFRSTTRNVSLVVMGIATAREIGIRSPYSVTDVMRGLVCYCDRRELANLAERMSEAESVGGTGRSYYAVDYGSVVGPVERSLALVELLGVGLAVGVFLSVWCLVVMVAEIFWQRRSYVYAVEALSGATETSVHVRAQMLIALSITLPSLAGYGLVTSALRGSQWPPSLPPGAGLVAVTLIVALHAIAGLANGWRVHGLYKFPRVEVFRV